MREHKTISIADQIFDRLEKEILSGKYKRGEIVSENKLAESLGVSRTPVREAVKRLEQEGIIEDCSKGFRIIGITRDDMPDMYEIRIQIESLAAGRAAENISVDELKEMGEILDMQKYYIDRQNGEGTDNSENIKDLDSRFHNLIYISSRSKAFADMLIPLHKRMTKFRKASVRKNSRAQSSWNEHNEIYTALREHNIAWAEEAMRRHLINARDSIMTIEEE
ncbi:MAG: GntR family transcriptional regulator [Firmicutes bacterium]|nr:GntR family transcriptional regulator [Bacillota bacterium]